MLPTLSPSEFVLFANQSLETAFPLVEIKGEIRNYKLSKGRWVYFDIADEYAKLRCFGLVSVLPTLLEEGMEVRVVAAPRLHQSFGFSLHLQNVSLSGSGTIKKAADLLARALEKEGLFATERKRTIPYPPTQIALITSSESAAYKDFVKILGNRYGGIRIELADVQVQGDAASKQIVSAVEWFNRQAKVADVIVIIRGGGSADDLQAFSSEQVVRVIAASRIPTCVAIGHEIDISLAELAADLRASTPSNAAELLVPDRKVELQNVQRYVSELSAVAERFRIKHQDYIDALKSTLNSTTYKQITEYRQQLTTSTRTLHALSPRTILKRGYSIVRKNGKVVRKIESLKIGTSIAIELADGNISAKVE